MVGMTVAGEAGERSALAALRSLAIERICYGQVGSDHLIEVGLSALLAGVDSPSLRLLAGLGRREEPEAPELFDRVLDELDLVPSLPADREQALWAMARWWCDLIVAGEIDPLAGADLVWSCAAMQLRYPQQLREIVKGAINGEDWTESWTISLGQIKSEIVRAAAEFVSASRHDQGPDRDSIRDL
jgi:hypothetical protein